MTGTLAEIGTMSLADLQRTLDWAAAEGWNPGLHDAVPFHVADPAGFLVATKPGDAAPAAAISVVRYTESFGFLGLYIARPDRRGQGFGWQVWQAGMGYLAGCCVGLDGVVAQQDNYRRSGFALSHRNIRYQGEPPRGGAPSLPVTPLRTIPFDRLAAFDRRYFGMPRPGFLAAWIGMVPDGGVAAVRDGTLTGYGVVRPCRRGWKIGPLFATDAATAEAIFLALAAKVPAGPIILDCPEPNRSAVALAERSGLTPVFETARMYTGPAPDMDLGGVFGVTTFELG